MTRRVAQLVTVLSELGVLTAEQREANEIDPSDSLVSDDSHALVEQLVREGKLTSFQASLILAGRASDLRIGNYLLLEKLGEGGMGTVYKAVHSLLQRTVALKTIRRTTAGDALERFRQEIEALGRLNHPHVVRATHAGESRGAWYLVMDLVEGVDLMRLVRERGPLSLADACEIVRQSAVGMQAIHECGLVHRDIKPSNLMLSTTGTIRILDLGLAKVRREGLDERRLTAAGQILGTVDYIAPEQAAGDTDVDIRADIYSLGCTLYRLLTGVAPYSGPRYPGKLERLLGHLQDPFPNIRSLRPDTPPRLAEILQRMVAKNPAARYASPMEFERAVQPYCTGADLAALSSGSSSHPPLASVAPHQEPLRHVQLPQVAPAAPAGVTASATWVGRRGGLLFALVATSVFAAVIAHGIPSERMGASSTQPLAAPVSRGSPDTSANRADRNTADRTPAEQRRFEAAAEIVSRLAKPPNEDAEGYAKLSAALDTIRNQQDFILLLRRLVSAAPDQNERREFASDKLAEAAQRYFQREQPEAVLQLWETGLELDPDSEYWQARRGYDRAIWDCTVAIRAAPDDPGHYRRRARLWMEVQIYEHAIADYTQSIALKPAPDAYNGRGLVWHAQGDLDKALADYSSAVELDPAHKWAWANRGAVWRDKRQYDKALSDLDQAIAIDPDYVWAFNERGRMYHAAGDYPKAIADYTAAIQRDPEYKFAWHNRGSVHALRGNYSAALADFAQAVRIDREYASAWNEMAWLMAACPDVAIRHGPQAIEAASRACELTGWRNGNYLDTLAAAYAEAGQFDKAIEHQTKALELGDGDINAWHERLELYQNGRPYH